MVIIFDPAAVEPILPPLTDELPSFEDPFHQIVESPEKVESETVNPIRSNFRLQVNRDIDPAMARLFAKVEGNRSDFVYGFCFFIFADLAITLIWKFR